MEMRVFLSLIDPVIIISVKVTISIETGEVKCYICPHMQVKLQQHT